MKTKGQRLYESKSPPMLRVVLFEGRRFATEADVMLLPNSNHIGWEYLTQRYRDGWEKSAEGHSLFSGEAP